MSKVSNFIHEYAKLIATNPEFIEVFEEEKDGFVQITVKANKVDAGRLIGKDGNMVNSLKTIISACKAKTNLSYRIIIESKEAKN